MRTSWTSRSVTQLGKCRRREAAAGLRGGDRGCPHPRDWTQVASGAGISNMKSTVPAIRSWWPGHRPVGHADHLGTHGVFQHFPGERCRPIRPGIRHLAAVALGTARPPRGLERRLCPPKRPSRAARVRAGSPGPGPSRGVAELGKGVLLTARGAKLPMPMVYRRNTARAMYSCRCCRPPRLVVDDHRLTEVAADLSATWRARVSGFHWRRWAQRA
jgi:hypothetical protein